MKVLYMKWHGHFGRQNEGVVHEMTQTFRKTKWRCCTWNDTDTSEDKLKVLCMKWHGHFRRQNECVVHEMTRTLQKTNWRCCTWNDMDTSEDKMKVLYMKWHRHFRRQNEGVVHEMTGHFRRQNEGVVHEMTWTLQKTKWRCCIWNDMDISEDKMKVLYMKWHGHFRKLLYTHKEWIYMEEEWP